ncbi:MAG: diphthamide synthesis protein [Candidatus Pacearchaeota archaeon]
MVLLEDLREKYEFDLNGIASKILSKNYKSVLLQFPDGLKQYSTFIYDYLREKCNNVDFAIWLGSCFGACDIPDVDYDLIVQFGHSPYGTKVFNELD